MDNSFIKTFIHLFTKPEEVIDGYIHGLRKRYVNAFGYFAISITITGLYTFLAKDRLKEIIKFGDFSEQQAEMQSSLFDSTFQHQSIISFLLIPLLALLSRLVFLNYKKYNLTEHFVIYLYAYSHIVGIMTLVLLPLMFIANDFIIIMVIQFPVYIFYIAYVLKRLYEISIKKIMIKTLLFLIYGSVLYTIIIIAFTALMIVSGAVTIPAK